MTTAAGILSIPESIRDALFSEEVFSVYEYLQDKFALPEGSDIPLSECIEGVLAHELNLADVPQELQRVFPTLKGGDLQMAAADFMERIFQLDSMQGHIKGVSEYVSKWREKGDQEVVSGQEVSTKTSPGKQEIAPVSPEAAKPMRGPGAPQRLAFKLPKVKPIPEKYLAPPPASPLLPIEKTDLLTEADHEELNAHAQKASLASASAEPPMVVDLDGHMRTLKDALTGMLLQEPLLQRVLEIAKRRIVAEIDPYSTRSLLAAEMAKGGAGLLGGQLADVSLAIEDVYDAHQGHVLEGMREARKEELAKKRLAREAEGGQSSATKTTTVKKQPQVSRVQPRLSTESLPPSALPKPQMTDVRFVPRLSGPVEELRRMTIQEFRRISKDPRLVCERILDKVDALAETGYDKKIAGIKAWRESPVNQAYLTMTQEALSSGRTIDEVAQRAQQQSETALTPEELRAIVHLNGQLRF